LDLILVAGTTSLVNTGLHCEASAVFTPSFPMNGLNTTGLLKVAASTSAGEIAFE
jgi:hypothetical protein